MHFNKDIYFPIEFRVCPVCKNKPYKRFEQFLKNKIVYDTVICDNCGFVYQNPIYNKKYYHSLLCSYPINYLEHSKKRAKYILDFCNEYLKDKEKINVLDIGAGYGGVIKYIVENLSNLDLSPGQLAIAITLEDLENMKVGSYVPFKFDIESDESFDNFINTIGIDTKFDFIVMSHVLEHFINPDKVIKKVIELLAPDGIVYIEVPSLYTAEYRIKSVWTPEHLSYFNTKTLSRLMYQNNFYLGSKGIRIDCSGPITDSKVWGNIKSVWKYDNGLETFRWSNDFNVKNKYKTNKFAKFIQRIKHKLGFKYEANI